ncbi:MAG: GPR endopeptidase [Clostridiales bacterium]|jgi:spore protease|nr:GPR endopeptidase [Clostridiales bacterium]
MKDKSYQYTDMAVEISGIKQNSSENINGNIKKSVSIIRKTEEKSFGKPEGKYITLECGNFFKDEKIKKQLKTALTEALKELLEHLKITAPNKILVVGVGNILMTADALGPECINKINPVINGDLRLCTLIPGVIGMTGIESLDLVSAAAEKIKPDLIIAVDTLAANKTERLSRSFQLSTSGLQPGGGVKNHRPPINADTLKIPVIAVGVPLVVYAVNIAKDIIEAYGNEMVVKKNFAAEKNKRFFEMFKDMIVTVKDINVAVGECSDIIADAINSLVDP